MHCLETLRFVQQKLGIAISTFPHGVVKRGKRFTWIVATPDQLGSLRLVDAAGSFTGLDALEDTVYRPDALVRESLESCKVLNDFPMLSWQ